MLIFYGFLPALDFHLQCYRLRCFSFARLELHACQTFGICATRRLGDASERFTVATQRPCEVIKTKLLEKSEGNFSEQSPGPWVNFVSFFFFFGGSFGPFSLEEQADKIYPKIHGKIQIRIWEFRDQNPHCKDLALRNEFPQHVLSLLLLRCMQRCFMGFPSWGCSSEDRKGSSCCMTKGSGELQKRVKLRTPWCGSLKHSTIVLTPPRKNITKIIRPEYFYVIFRGGYGKIT